MPNTVLGKVSVTPKGAWSGSSSYEKLDIVSNSGNSYIALQNVPSGTALSNSSYWLMIAEKGDKGDKGDTGATGATGATGNGISSVEVEETSVVGSVHTYTLTISMTDGTSEAFTYDVTDGSVTSVNGRTGAVTGLAEDNGYYDEMTVGGAEQLISSTYVEDSVPYVFRTSGGSADIGDREFDEVVGGTVAWNQLYNGYDRGSNPLISQTVNGVTFTVNEDKSISTSGTATADAYFSLGIPTGNATNSCLKNGEKAYIGGCPKGGSANTYSIAHRYLGGADTGNGAIITDGNSIYSGSVQISIKSGTDATGLVFKPQFMNLTKTFGSAIADYIYSLEQSSTGSGVAWFKALFPKPYYAFNSGELISVSGLSAHKMTGFNQWDEQWEVGSISNTTGLPAFSTTCIRSKNFIPVTPNTSYYIKASVNIAMRYYDADMNFLGVMDANNTGDVQTGSQYSKLRTTPNNCHYIKFQTWSNTGATYNHDICINLHWDGERDGEYEPYEVHEYALDDSLTLRGIPKLDADNKLYYDGDVYASDGTVQRRYGVVDLSTLSSWGIASTATADGSICKVKAISGMSTETSVNSMVSDNYVGASGTYIVSMTINTMIISGGTLYVAVADADTDPSGYFVYPLATPTTESAEPYTNPQIVDDWGTEEYVIAEQSGVAIPVGHETKYTANLKAKLEMAPDSPSGNGDWIVRQTNGINTYVPLTERIPNAPSENGNYILKCTVNGSTVTYTWEAQS